MTWFRDLHPLAGDDIIAVGWLEPGKDHAKGEVSNEFVDALAKLLVDPWEPFHIMGPHKCGFCRFRFSEPPASVQIGGRSTSFGITNLFVPDGAKLFVCPSMIIHYADAHEYAPPDAFVAAVLRCPPMNSMDYLKAIKSFVPRLRNLPL